MILAILAPYAATISVYASEDSGQEETQDAPWKEYNGKKIGVITPFVKQNELIKKELEFNNLNFTRT